MGRDPEGPMDKELRFAAAFLLPLAVAGCVNGRSTTTLEAEDRSTFIPTLRVAADVGGRDAPRSQPHTSHAIELGLTGARGGDTQRLAASQNPVVFGNTTFAAGQDLRAEFDFRFAEIAYRYRHVFERTGLGVEGLAGLGYAQLGLTVTGTTQRAAERLRNGGLVLGVGGLWRIRPSTSLQLRGTGFGAGSSEGVTSASRIDLQIEQAIGRHGALRGGYAWWSVYSEREEEFGASTNSPIRVRFSGPTLGLELMF